MRLARQRGERTDMIVDALIVMAVAALLRRAGVSRDRPMGYYKDHLSQIVLPPYSGLGIYGGLFTGLLAMIWWRATTSSASGAGATSSFPPSFWLRSSVRWGNFMNQELYGPPTDLPWGIAIQCQNRVVQYACPGTPATAHFIRFLL